TVPTPLAFESSSRVGGLSIRDASLRLVKFGGSQSKADKRAAIRPTASSFGRRTDCVGQSGRTTTREATPQPSGRRTFEGAAFGVDAHEFRAHRHQLR